MLRWFGWIKIHLQWLNWFKTSYGQASCFYVSQELHSSRALPTMPLSKCTNPATLSSVVKGWYQVRNIHRMPWCWFPLKKIYCTCDKDKTLHYHTWDQQQKNDCQTISIKKKQDLKMFEIIFNKHQDPFPPDTRCLLEDQSNPNFQGLCSLPRRKVRSISQKTLDLKSHLKYSPNKNTSRMNDWNKFKRRCFINK